VLYEASPATGHSKREPPYSQQDKLVLDLPTKERWKTELT